MAGAGLVGKGKGTVRTARGCRARTQAAGARRGGGKLTAAVPGWNPSWRPKRCCNGWRGGGALGKPQGEGLKMEGKGLVLDSDFPGWV